MRKLNVIAAVLLVSALGCQKEDPRIGEILEKLDKMDKKLDRPSVGAAPAPRRGPDANVVYNLPVADTDVTRGAKVAKVTVIEGFDFACPYCAQARPGLEEAAAAHGNDVRVVSKQFVVHPQVATLPALAVCAAQKQGKGNDMENAIWGEAWKGDNGRPNFDATKLAQDAIEKTAAAQKLDVEKLKADMASEGCKADIARQQKELASIGVNGTPAFYINGKPYQGARTKEGFTAAIEEEIKRVDAALKNGTKVEDYYANLMRTAQKSL